MLTETDLDEGEEDEEPAGDGEADPERPAQLAARHGVGRATLAEHRPGSLLMMRRHAADDSELSKEQQEQDFREQDSMESQWWRRRRASPVPTLASTPSPTQAP